MIETKDSLEFLKERQDFEFDIMYSDPPYALGSEVIIREDGMVDYKKANDFMNKWSMPTGDYWNAWFKEAYRTLKHGGYCIMFGMDRQLLLFKYYAKLAGFEEHQSLYWYFISNFPKATDLSKQIDKKGGNDYVDWFGKWLKEWRIENDISQKEISKLFPSKTGGLTGCVANWELGLNMPTPEQFSIIVKHFNLPFETIKEAKREVIGKKMSSLEGSLMGLNKNCELNSENYGKEIAITAPSTNLAKKYNGYKYSISPLKQTNETIMVFQKPYKTGSCMRDTLAYENGDDTCTCGALNIDGNRVETDDNLNGGGYNINGTSTKKLEDANAYATKVMEKEFVQPDGRYPSQTFCNNLTAEVLDRQSGVKVSKVSKVSNKGSIWGSDNEEDRIAGHNDTGGCSKILHKCNYENDDHDLYFYNPKVSKSERNAGCDGDEKQYSHDGRNKPIENPYQRNNSVSKNIHPTLKPISLNEKILKLFKTPNDQLICYPFAGSFSEVIGGYKAGFTNFVGCEINPEYIEIGNARLKYWTEQFDKESKDKQLNLLDFIDQK